MELREDSALRMKLWDGLLDADEQVEGDMVRQHELSCVRRGVAARIAREAGADVSSRRSALYFLRGMSAEALIRRGKGRRTAYKGITCSTDEWLGGVWNFIEYKSTMLSSSHLWKMVKSGNADLNKPSKMLSWLRQCAIYCVAFRTDRCKLGVFFLHGDYADRRVKCPECGSRDLEDGRLYKRCRECNYKSYFIDLRTYNLIFTPEELAEIEREVFDIRQGQFRLAWEDWARERSIPNVLRLAPPTPSFACWDCKAGKYVGCEWYGEGFSE